jgi:hypothetical protein
MQRVSHHRERVSSAKSSRKDTVTPKNNKTKANSRKAGWTIPEKLKIGTPQGRHAANAKD